MEPTLTWSQLFNLSCDQLLPDQLSLEQKKCMKLNIHYLLGHFELQRDGSSDYLGEAMECILTTRVIML